MVSRTMPSTVLRLRSAPVVISPATTARSVVTSVSHATRLRGSAARQWSRMASLIWSATLSGWPIDTDSEVNKYRSLLIEGFLLLGPWGSRVRLAVWGRIIRDSEEKQQSQLDEVGSRPPRDVQP